MDAIKFVDAINHYTKKSNEIDIERLDRHYIFKGKFMLNGRQAERAEIGEIKDTVYKPHFQARLGNKPEFEAPGHSYLDEENEFAGCAYRLTGDDFQDILRKAA